MMFALVKWLTGKEKDTHTVIDATWIRDVDVKQYDNKEEQQCVVEWRVPGTGSKKHKQQKSCHDAILVRISEKSSELERLMWQREKEDEDETPDVITKREKKVPSRFEDCPTTSAQRSGKIAGSADSAKKRKVQSVVAKWTDPDAKQRRISELEAENSHLKSSIIRELPKLMSYMAAVLAYNRRSFQRDEAPTTPSAAGRSPALAVTGSPAPYVH